MKKLVLLLTGILLFGCKATDVTVLLTVDAQTLFNNPNPPKKQLQNIMTLSDNNKSIAKLRNFQDLELFKTKVHAGYRVTWIGISRDRNYSVAIDSIVASVKKGAKSGNRNQDIFNSRKLFGWGGKYSIVSEKVKDKETGIFEYTIFYTIYEDGNNNGKGFKIDPKLRAK